MLLGMTADEVAPLKEAPDPKPYEALLERVAWGEWLLRVQSRTQCAALPWRPALGTLASLSVLHKPYHTHHTGPCMAHVLSRTQGTRPAWHRTLHQVWSYAAALRAADMY